MATYNGGRWIDEQLASTLAELGPDDEVVVVDDASKDDTVARVRAFDDPRVRVVVKERNAGYVKAFETALGLAGGEYVLLADQDDVWEPGRVAAMVAALGSVDVVASNLSVLGRSDGLRGPYGQHDWRLRAADSRRRWRNIIGVLAGNRPYYGSAMGLRRSALGRVLPFPPYLTETHDLWIALYGNVAGSIRHLEQRTVRRRLHDSNASPDRPRGATAVLRSRLLLLRCLRELRRRTR
jgi:glycosyltransferase involved in cell wall biosynthesis